MGVRSPKGSGSEEAWAPRRGPSSRRARVPRGAAARRRLCAVEAPAGGEALEVHDQLARRARRDRRDRGAAGVRHPGVRRQALPHPERLDGADAGDRASACSSIASATTSSKPHVGEIAVFHPPEGAENEQCGPVAHTTVTLRRRCLRPDQPAGGVGQLHQARRRRAGRHDLRQGRPRLPQGRRHDALRARADSYIGPAAGVQECNFPTPITIPAGHWFMMGDNRGESDDSRFWGPVPTSWIIGEAFATYWPPDRIGSL